MNSRFKKATSFSLALLLIIALCAGCTGNNGTTDTGTQTTASTAPTSAATTVPTQKPDPFGKQAELTVLTRGFVADPNFTLIEGDTWEDNVFTKMLEKDFNIKIETAFSAGSAADYSQKVDLAIASANIPDYISEISYTQFRKIVKSGLAYDITQVWNDYASDMTKSIYASNKDLFDSLVVQDDKMYAIPSSNPEPDFLQVMWIRQDWLDKLSLNVPKNMEELEAVAKAFIEKAPGGEGTIGIGGPTVNGKLYQDLQNTNFSFSFDPIFSAYNAFPGIWVNDNQGKAVYGSTLPETKAALQKLSDMYQQGLINQGMLTAKTEELVSSGKCGLFFGTWWWAFIDINNSWKLDPSADWHAYQFPGEGVAKAKGGNVARSVCVIGKNCKNPEAVIKMLNMFKKGVGNFVPKDDKNQVLLDNGAGFPFYLTFSLRNGPALARIGCDEYFSGKKTVEQVRAEFKELDAYIMQSFNQTIDCKTQPFSDTSIKGFDFTGANADKFAFVWGFYTGMKPYADGSFKFVSSLSYETTTTMERRWANLSKVEFETFSKIIVGQESIDTFDQFVQQWKAEGGDQITTEIQDTLKG